MLDILIAVGLAFAGMAAVGLGGLVYILAMMLIMGDDE